MPVCGVITGCDCEQEWLLPWWWHHYSKHCCYPVAFADFGMSEQALDWCKQRGDVYTPLPTPGINASVYREEWDPYIRKNRSAWMKKPFACKEAPFDHSLWIDLDCEVRAELDVIFTILRLGAEIALALAAEKKECLKPEEIGFNSGVIGFHRQSPILGQWVQTAERYQHELPGDEEMLSRAIHLFKPKLIALNRFYNWFADYAIDGPNHPEAKIVHYVGAYGKRMIQYRFFKSS